MVGVDFVPKIWGNVEAVVEVGRLDSIGVA